MLSKQDKRFIRYWEDQRKGGMLSYWLLYSLIGTFIMSLFVLVFLLLVLQVYFSWFILILVAAGCFFITAIISMISWQQNEKRWKNIIHKVVDEGKLSDPGTSSHS